MGQSRYVACVRNTNFAQEKVPLENDDFLMINVEQEGKVTYGLTVLNCTTQQYQFDVRHLFVHSMESQYRGAPYGSRGD